MRCDGCGGARRPRVLRCGVGSDAQRAADAGQDVDATLAGFFIIVVLAVLFYGIRTILASRSNSSPTAKETPYVAMPGAQVQ